MNYVYLNRLLLTFVLSIGYNVGLAQIMEIKGGLLDTDGQAVPFATLSLNNDSSIISATISDSTGFFSLKGEFGENYKLIVNHLSYKEKVVEFKEMNNNIFHKIVLEGRSETMNEITVSAKKPTIVKKIDRFIFNIDNSQIAKGKNGLEALRFAPGIIISPGNHISLNGKTGILFYIDGKRLNFSTEESIQFISNIRAEEIDRYEIIPNASAIYGAEGQGGVIDIYLKKSVNRGVKATFYNETHFNKKFGTDNGTSISFNSEKVSAYGNYSYSDEYNYFKESGEKYFLEDSLYQLFNDVSEGRTYLHNYRLGLVKHFGNKHTFGLEFYGNSLNNNDRSNSLTDLYIGEKKDSSVQMISNDFINKENANFNINYSWILSDKIKTFIIGEYSKISDNKLESYSIDDSYSTNVENTSGISNQGVRKKYNIFSLQSDIEYNRNKWIEFSFGGRYSRTSLGHIVEFNEVVFNSSSEIDDYLSYFEYNEVLAATYGMLNFEISKQIDGNIGLRNEYIYREYFYSGKATTFSENKIFPSFFVQYKFKNSDKLYASYTNRVNRPIYSSVIPFKLFMNPFTIAEGNPNLRSSYVNTYSVSALIKGLNFSFSYDDIVNKIYPVFIPQKNKPGVTSYRYENIADGLQFRASISKRYDILDFWELYSNGVVTYNEFYDDYFKLNQDVFYYRLNLANSLRLPQDILLDVNFLLMSRSIMGVAELQDGGLLLSLGIGKDFLNEKISSSISFNDILGQLSNLRSISNYNNIKTEIYSDFNEQGISFSISYNFNGGKQNSNGKNKHGNYEEKARAK